MFRFPSAMGPTGSIIRKAQSRTGHTLYEIINFTTENDTCYLTDFRVLREGKLASVESAHLDPRMTASATAAPAGYSFTNVFSVENTMFNYVLNSSFAVNNYCAITFAIMTNSQWINYCGTGSSAGGWRILELLKNGSGTWDVYVMWATGSLTSKATGRTGQTLKEIMNFSSEKDTCYITNLRVLENA